MRGEPAIRSSRALPATGVQRHGAVGGGFVPVDPQLFAGVIGQRVGADRLAGLGAAQLQHGAPGGLGAEIVIEGHHAMGFGPADRLILRDDGQRGLGDVAKGRLNRVKDRQQRALHSTMRFEDLVQGLRLGSAKGRGG